MKIKKPILINQPGNIGDLIHIMAIAQDYVNRGHEVIIPVPVQLLSIRKNFPTINFPLINEFPDWYYYENNNNCNEDDKYILLPLGKSPFWNGDSNRNMLKKYNILNLSGDMWRNVKITRDYDAENKLFNQLGLKEGDKYNLINEYYKNTFEKISISVNTQNGCKNLYINRIGEYNLFDWLKTMENAQSIHTVGTAIVFLMDVFNSMPNDMHIYPRGDLGNHGTYDYLLNKKYIYH